MMTKALKDMRDLSLNRFHYFATIASL